MKLRRTTILAIGLATLVSLSACGGNSGSEGGSKEADGTVTLDWEMWAASEDEKAQLDHMAKLVTKEHPKIRINLRTAPFGSYFTKLQTEFAAGNEPCIVSMQSLRLAQYAHGLQPLDPGPEKADFHPAALAALELDGKQFALPYDLGSMLMYYNKDAFAKAGLPEPKAGWTVQDFETAVHKLAADGKAGFGMSTGDLHMMSLLLTYNGARAVTDDVKLDIDNPKMVEALTWYAGLAKGKHASVPASASEAGWGETQFMNGNAMMAVDGSWSFGAFAKGAKFKVGVAPLPIGTGGSTTLLANSGFGISKSCKYQDEARQAVSVLTGAKVAEYLAGEGRSFPARTAQQSTYEQFLLEKDPQNAATIKAATAAVKDGVAGGVPLFTTKNWDVVGKLMSRYLLQAYTGELTPANSLKTIQQQGGSGQ